MILQRILPYSKSLLKQVVESGDVVIDGTAGNGHDTLFLAQLVGESGHVYSFDVQETAIENTRQRMVDHQMNHVTVVHDGHQHVKKYMAPHHQLVSAAIFNLGYLPGSDHSITTEGETTLTAIKEILSLLKLNGIIVLVVYHGHEQGKLEKNYLLDQLSQLDQKQVSVLEYRYLNQKGDAPFILALEKVKA